ncbi:hypothetical protein BDD43_2234 [Mucilaginibacter gracilis]|uniref:Uncharacterized protein n=1 Tax=Mucilaginibacter gracilis TaxID=423350 RepID=A0A495IZF3_9SPHI|nr:hypothetical protein [Mucilaginibacter gracilis]RKR82067.1 hypothetical protein BDD43_2234 [Mucilaginibacter gracilis]
MKLNNKTMNKLLNPISWSAYLETVAVLAIAWYAFIGWKYYRHEIRELIARISGQKDDSRELPAALQYQSEADADATAAQSAIPAEQAQSIYEEPLLNQDELAQELTRCISEATDKPYAPASLIPKLKKILNDYPDVAATPDRDEINALIVRECERTGTALLSESEVDMWWSA